MALEQQSNRRGTWIDLKIKCPACDNSDISQWEHSKDHQKSQINQYADVSCASGHNHPFIHWKWDCGHHQNETYKEANAEQVGAIVTKALKVTKDLSEENAMWLFRLANNLAKQFHLDEDDN